jgi:hypothetical protein
MRWTTGIGIALGGVGGAIAALIGAPKAAPSPPPPAAVVPDPPGLVPAPVPDAPSATPLPALVSAPSASAIAAPVAVTAPPPAASVAASATVIAPPALDIPSTREALLKAEMLCDRRKDFDSCARAAVALETGTTGPADLEQAKRFRRIALTHLVAQCEALSPHACFVLAAKYRSGTELARNLTSAEALEKRGAELCRLGRPAPECPPP